MKRWRGGGEGGKEWREYRTTCVVMFLFGNECKAHRRKWSINRPQEKLVNNDTSRTDTQTDRQIQRQKQADRQTDGQTHT